MKLIFQEIDKDNKQYKLQKSKLNGKFQFKNTYGKIDKVEADQGMGERTDV